MFSNCYNLNQNILINFNKIRLTSGMNRCIKMFHNCTKMSDITLGSGAIVDAFRMFIDRNDNFRRNIWTDMSTFVNLRNTFFMYDAANNMSYRPNSSVAGNNGWLEMDNGYYSPDFNIYVYTNAVFPE